jgi:hypothetical protein
VKLAGSEQCIIVSTAQDRTIIFNGQTR